MSKLIYEGFYPTSVPKFNVTDDGQIYEGLYPTGNPIANIKDNIIYEGFYQSNPIGCIRDGQVYGSFYPTGNPVFNFNGSNAYDDFYASNPRYCIRENSTMYDDCSSKRSDYDEDDEFFDFLCETAGCASDDMAMGASPLYQELL